MAVERCHDVAAVHYDAVEINDFPGKRSRGHESARAAAVPEAVADLRFIIREPTATLFAGWTFELGRG